MSNHALFFRLLADCIDANGGKIPDHLLNAVGMPLPQKKEVFTLPAQKKKRTPMDEHIDAIVMEKLYGIKRQKNKHTFIL